MIRPLVVLAAAGLLETRLVPRFRAVDRCLLGPSRVPIRPPAPRGEPSEGQRCDDEAGTRSGRNPVW
jgi:hypothetical protein